MAETQTIGERNPEKLRGRDRRSCNLSTKLTTNEAKAVEEAAKDQRTNESQLPSLIPPPSRDSNP